MPGGVRGLWLLGGILSLVAGVVVGSPWLLLAWLAPDLGVLAGGRGLVDQHGRLSTRAAVGYNATHMLVGPCLLAGAAALTSSALLWALALLWTSHIAVDRGLGYGLRPVHG